MKFLCDICKKTCHSKDPDMISINFREYYICPDCMWHFREMFGKLQEERRKEDSNAEMS